MHCPHCGNEIYQPLSAMMSAPNVNGCAPTTTLISQWIDTTNLNPTLLGPSICSGAVNTGPSVTIKFDAQPGWQNG